MGLDTNEVILIIIPSIMTTILSYVSYRVLKYISRRERKEAKLQLHYIKQEALLQAIGEVFTNQFGTQGRNDFMHSYEQHRERLIKESTEVDLLYKAAN